MKNRSTPWVVTCLSLVLLAQTARASEPEIVASKASGQMKVFNESDILRDNFELGLPKGNAQNLLGGSAQIFVRAAIGQALQLPYFLVLGSWALAKPPTELGRRIAIPEMKPMTEAELVQNATLSACTQRQSQMLSALLDRADVKQVLEEQAILKTQIHAFDMNSKLITRFDARSGEFKVKRPDRLSHLIEELGSQRAKSYQEVRPLKARVAQQVLTVGVYEFKGVCVVGSEDEILNALQSAPGT